MLRQHKSVLIYLFTNENKVNPIFCVVSFLRIKKNLLMGWMIYLRNNGKPPDLHYKAFYLGQHVLSSYTQIFFWNICHLWKVGLLPMSIFFTLTSNALELLPYRRFFIKSKMLNCIFQNHKRYLLNKTHEKTASAELNRGLLWTCMCLYVLIGRDINFGLDSQRA